jgi:hypothetical protein
MPMSSKGRQTNSILEKETLTLKHPEVLDIGLVAG